VRANRFVLELSIYVQALVSAATGELPSRSGRPCLIQATVAPTGLEPTCKYIPSRGGENFPYCEAAASESGGKSTTKIAFETGYSPTPSPAFVSALANATLAFPSLANTCCAGSCSSHALYEDGENTRSPSLRFNDMLDRDSLMNSGDHPNFERTIAISFARFWASGSPGATWINIFVPAKRLNPANHVFAFGSPSNPTSPTLRGNSTVCSAKLSAFSRSVSLLGYSFGVHRRRSSWYCVPS
jgi:hypothetical protein